MTRARATVGRGALGVAVLVGAATACTGDGMVSPSPTPTFVSVPAPTVAAPTALPPTALPPPAATTGPGVDFLMPDLQGTDLQSAQDAVQAYDVFFSRSHDLLEGREQVVDANWIVCDQAPAPGERVTGIAEGAIDFGVVKRDETCP